MPSEVVLDTTLGEITPRPGKAPLDTWRALARPGRSCRDNRVIKYGPSPTM